MDRKRDMLNDNHRLLCSNSNFRRSFASYCTTKSGPLPFLKTLFPAVIPISIGVEGVLSITHFASDSLTLIRGTDPTRRGYLFHIASVSRFK